MRAAIRSLLSIDVDDLDGWTPESESWALGLQIIAGPDSGPGEESFDLTVCNLAWLAERVRSDGIFDGRHHLIVEWYHWPALRAYVERRVQQCAGATWHDVAGQLARLGYWEFENYEE